MVNTSKKSSVKNLVSIIIVNYNGAQFINALCNCLLSLTYSSFEVIFVDNNSTDDSLLMFKKKFPTGIIVENSENSGFAGGNNLGFQKSQGEFILLLNNDTTFGSALLTDMLAVYRSIDNCGALQPKIRLMDEPEKMDSCGSFWTSSGFLYHYGHRKNHLLDKYSSRKQIYSVKGVCLLTDRKCIELVGLFDNDYWCYFEETDFCHRLLLAGKECWYSPEPQIFHSVGGTSSSQKQAIVQFHSFKNRLNSYIKNLGFKMFVRILPIYLLLNFGWICKLLLKGEFRLAAAPILAIFWNLKNMKETLKKRSQVQLHLRVKSDKEIFSKITLNPPIHYYLAFEGNSENFVDIDTPCVSIFDEAQQKN